MLNLFAAAITSEFSFPESTSLQRSQSSYVLRDHRHNYDEDQPPQAKHMHQIKRLRKRLILLCLVNGGKGQNGRSVDSEAKFLYFPTLVQQTDVSVSDDDHDDAGVANDLIGHGGGVNCGNLMASGLLNHPLLGPLGGGGENTDTDSDNRFYGMNFRRQVLRPFYRTMRRFYRLL